MNTLINAIVVLLEPLFFLGMLGSALVIVLTAVDDIREMFVKEKGSGAA